MRCPHCSEEIPADSILCEHCGGAVAEPERTDSAEAQRLQAQPATQQLPEGRISAPDPSVPQRTSPVGPWYKIWLQAFFRPTQDTIEVLLRGHDRNPSAPYLWLFFSYTIGYGLWFIPYSLTQADVGVMWVIVVPSLIGILGMIVVRILVAVTQFVASRLLGGEGASSELFYIYAAMDSPARLIGGIIALLSLIAPLIGYLGWAVSIYELVLLAIAAKAINRFSWSKAILAASPAIALQICNLLW